MTARQLIIHFIPLPVFLNLWQVFGLHVRKSAADENREGSPGSVSIHYLKFPEISYANAE